MGAKVKRRRGSDELIDQRFIEAISHPTRIMILVETTQAPMSLKEFTERHGGSSSTNYHHFRKLQECGAIEEVASRPCRGATEHFYRATYRTLFSEEAFGQLPPAVRTSLSATVITTFIDVAEKALLANTIDDPESRHLTWYPLELDREGFETLMERLNEIFASLPLEMEAARQRMEVSGEEPMPTTVAMFGFRTPPPDRDHALDPVGR